MPLLLEGDSYSNIEQKIYDCIVRLNIEGYPELGRIHVITRLVDSGQAVLAPMHNIYTVLNDALTGLPLVAIACLNKEAYLDRCFGKEATRDETKAKSYWAKIFQYKEKMIISVRDAYKCPVVDVQDINDVLSAFLPNSRYVNTSTTANFYARKSPRRWERSFKLGITHERHSPYYDDSHRELLAAVTGLMYDKVGTDALANPDKYYLAPRQAVKEILAKRRISAAVNENYSVWLFPHGNKWDSPNFHLRVLYQDTCVGLVLPDSVSQLQPLVKLFPQAAPFREELEEAGFAVIS